MILYVIKLLIKMTESSSITMIDYNKAFKKPPEALIQKKIPF